MIARIMIARMRSAAVAGLLILGIASLSGCGLVPGMPEQMISLTAKPAKNIYPMLTRFDPEKELEVKALYDTGENFIIPPSAWTASIPPDTAAAGEQTGSVQYNGKTATYEIFVYSEDSSYNGGGNGNGGTVLEVPCY